MSGHSYDAYCPNCSQTCAEGYSDHKPHDYVSVRCMECGFIAETVTRYLPLEELNEARRENNDLHGFIEGDEDALPMLTKLPEQDPAYAEPTTIKGD